MSQERRQRRHALLICVLTGTRAPRVQGVSKRRGFSPRMEEESSMQIEECKDEETLQLAMKERDAGEQTAFGEKERGKGDFV